MGCIEDKVTEIWVEDLNSSAKCVNFPQFKVRIHFWHKLTVHIWELLFRSQDTQVEISIMGDHSAISVGAQKTASIEPPGCPKFC